MRKPASQAGIKTCIARKTAVAPSARSIPNRLNFQPTGFPADDKSAETFPDKSVVQFFGYRSSVLTQSTDAKRKSSLSLTHRKRASICDNVARLISRPLTWQRPASSSCVKPSLFRKRRICGPTTLAGVFVRAMLRNSKLDLKRKKDVGLLRFHSTMRICSTLYRRRGKPERAMAEIRRMLLRKISARLEKKRGAADLLKESAPPKRISIRGNDF